MSNEELNDLLAKVAASAKQVNILTGDHASAPFYEAGAESPETPNTVQEDHHKDIVVDAIHELTDVVKESMKEPKVQNIYGDKNEFQYGAQLLKMAIPEGADPAEIAARIAEQQRALLEQKKQKK